MAIETSCRSILAIFIFALFLSSPFFSHKAFADTGTVYWSNQEVSDFTISRIGRAGISTSNDNVEEDFIFRDLASITRPVGIALDVENNKIYWADADQDNIMRADLDTGDNLFTFLNGADLDLPHGIALDLRAGERKIYWTESNNDVIRRANLDGTPVIEELIDLTTLLSTSINPKPRQIALDLTRGKMYWADFTEDTIRRADLDGQNPEAIFDLTDGVDEPRGVAIDPRGSGTIYWTQFAPESMIRRASLSDLSTFETLLQTSVNTDLGTSVFHIVVDTFFNKIYWADLGTGAAGSSRIQRTTISDPVGDFEPNFITGLDRTVGLAVHSTPELPPGAFPALGFMMSGLLLWLRRRIGT